MEIDIDTNSIGQNLVKLNNVVDDMLATKLNIFDEYLASKSLSYCYIKFNLINFLILKDEKVFVAYGNIVRNHQNSYEIQSNDKFFIYINNISEFHLVCDQLKEKNYLINLTNLDNLILLKDNNLTEDKDKESRIKSFLLIFHHCVMLYCTFFSKYKFNIHDKIIIINSEKKNESIILTKILQLFGLKVFFSVNSIYNKDEIFNEFKNNEVLFNEDINTLSTIKDFVLGVNFILDFQLTFINDRAIIYTLLSEGGTIIMLGKEKDVFQLDPHDLTMFFKKNLSIQIVNIDKFSDNFLKKGSLMNFLSNILIDMNIELISFLLRIDNYEEKKINITDEINEILSSEKLILNIVSN
jgi:hypothetical protein